MNDTNYFICKANQSQRDYVLERFVIGNEQDRKGAVIYVAVDEAGKIIGRIIVVQREIPSQIEGQYWHIKNLLVNPEYRRKGIATALVNEIKLQAAASEAVYLHGCANATLEAGMFWLKQGVTLTAFGKKQDDPSKPKSFGNYYHMFSFCLESKALSKDSLPVSVRAVSKDEIPHLINKYAPTERKRLYWLGKADELFGFATVGADGEPQGMILAFSDSMHKPFDGTQWWTSLFVVPKYRNRGIGRSLVCRMYQYAQEKDVLQLNHIESAEDYIGFWYELGFDIFFGGVNKGTGKHSAAAMMRVK